ncbi:uridine 5'-monophosphate synthase-like [Oppia nitens]|uniref:uridine 5'-monophosphate synthase-like n=1 Tax=Oppia nitens TaxID=1686743 RepID=UPI0023DC8B51|nr:uridine 5'-monophosphate synthase-like [Oppia nitens]
MTDQTILRQLIRDCFHLKAIKFGDFVLKTGRRSPIYLDIRPMVNQPEPLITLTNLMYDKLMAEKLEFDLICGVPYSALSIAAGMCVLKEYPEKDPKKVPMITKRKEMKDYGTKQMIEGVYQSGDRVVIIEDIISSGTSILETAITLRNAGLVVTDAVVFIDRQQNGVKNMKEFGLNIHSIIGVRTALKILEEEHLISKEQKDNTIQWIDNNRLDVNDDVLNDYRLLDPSNQSSSAAAIKRLSYEQRAELPTSHPLAKRLFRLMANKQSNLCVAVDLTDDQQILDLAKQIGDQIVILKLHIDIVDNFNDRFIDELKSIAEQKEFLIFEDRKFADIGQTVSLQYTKGVFKISSWAHIVNAHLTAGPGALEGLRKHIANNSERGCLLIASMSSKDSLMGANYTKTAYKWSKKFSDVVFGFISQSRVSADPSVIHMTPGVSIAANGDPLGQQYVSPETAINERGADVVIVGRGITSSTDVKQSAESYRKLAFDAYLNQISQ